MYMSLPESAWRGWCQDAFPHASWRWAGGTLHALAGARPACLVSRERFGDFDLCLKWRLPSGGSAGVFYRVVEEGEPWHSGPRMPLIGGDAHLDALRPETACGAMFELYEADDVPNCPPGVLNAARIRMKGSCVEHWLNGRCVLSVDVASEGFRLRQSRSRFRPYPQFARAVAGHIVLLHPGVAGEFRDLRIDAT